MIITHTDITSVKTSELIIELQRLISIHGDLPVFYGTDLGDNAIDFDFIEVSEAKDKARGWDGEEIEHYPKRIVL